MPLIVFESSGSSEPSEGVTVVVDAPEGGRLVDLCDEHHSPVPFSCRSASCGTCRVDLLEGADLLEPPHDDELEVLDLFGDDPVRCRLACQARVLAGSGRLRVRPADP